MPVQFQKANRSLTRLIHDDCSYKHRLFESTSPLLYNINPVSVEHCKKCHMGYPGFVGTLGGFGFGVGPDRVDVDSDLRGQTRIFSKCPSHKYNPHSYTYCGSCENCDKGLPCDCTHCKTKDVSDLNECRPGIIPLEAVENRNFNACSDLNGIFINRWDHLCQNPQVPGRWELYKNNRRLGEETRLDQRDYNKDCFNQRQQNREPCGTGGMGCRHLQDFHKNIY